MKTKHHERTSHADWLGRKIFRCVASRSKTAKECQRRIFEQVCCRWDKAAYNDKDCGSEVYRKIPTPTVNTKTMAFSLEYCLDDEDSELRIGCPWISLLKSQCRFRQKDFYNMPNTTSLICKVALPLTVRLYTVHKTLRCR